MILIALIACNNSHKETSEKSLMLYAAQGADELMKELCDSFTVQNNIKVETNFASSGILARQIQSGAQADLFISANKKWIDFLKENKLLNDESIKIFAKNKLVVICKNDNDNLQLDFSKSFNINSAIKNKIAIGDPEHVPAGNYAKQVLDTLQWFSKIKDNTILAMNVAAVTHYVEMGECDWGIVYSSEALKSDKVKIAYEIPENLYKPIVFYMASLKDADSNTQDLVKFIEQKESAKIIKKHGFTIE